MNDELERLASINNKKWLNGYLYGLMTIPVLAFAIKFILGLNPHLVWK